ncbi:E3 ubiquitin/ISG15 ligase TRIM25-like [Rhinophrynus dorsalis]
MATAALLCSEYLRCPVCLDLFREPVTIPCGHSFCLACITQCWSLQGASTSCPQCRCPFRMDSPPRLCKNSILSQMVDDFSNPQGPGRGVTPQTNPMRNPEEHLDSCNLQTMPEEDPTTDSIATPPLCRRTTEPNGPWVSLLRQRREVTQAFSDMVRVMQASGFRLLQLMEKAETRVMEQEETLGMGQAESEDMESGLTMIPLQPAQVGPSVHQDHLMAEEEQGSTQEELPWVGLSAALSKFKDSLLKLCADHMGQMVQQVWGTHNVCPALPPELWGSPLLPLIPRVRAEFLKYSRDITLDPDTAHHNLSLMQGNRRVLCKLQPQAYPDHPARFNHYTQVLGREPLGHGQHYWEVHLSGNRVSLGVAYPGICRKGHQSHCLAGRNSHSWCLEWTNTRCYAWHDGQRALVTTGQQEKLGVFLDWEGGSLSFHEVSDNMPLLHRFRASFIQPVYPIFFISWNSIVTIGDGPQTRHGVQTKRFHRQLSADF